MKRWYNDKYRCGHKDLISKEVDVIRVYMKSWFMEMRIR